jgi:hypothetical protein
VALPKTSKNLVGYCGLYCGACGIYQGKIKQAVENLRKVIGAYGFDKIAPELAKWEQSLKHYAEFEQVMKGLVKLFGECPACIGGGGDPNCAIRQCCKPRDYITCAECAELKTCKKLDRYSWAKKELQKVKAMGVDGWREEMQRKVDAGYCALDERLK